MGEPKVCGLGLLSLQIDNILVCVHMLPPSLKWEVETLFIVKKGLKICDHVSQGTCVHAFISVHVDRCTGHAAFLGSICAILRLLFKVFGPLKCVFNVCFVKICFQFCEVELRSYETNTSLISCSF